MNAGTNGPVDEKSTDSSSHSRASSRERRRTEENDPVPLAGI